MGETMRAIRGAALPGAYLTAIVAATVSCGAGTPQLVVFPPPPDTARFQYLTQFTSLDDMSDGGRSVLSVLVGTQEQESPIKITRPFGLAVGPGKIYVCDVRLPGVMVIDLDERTLRPITSPNLPNPINCTLDPVSGDLYVADTKRGKVIILGTSGTFEGVVGDSLGGPGDVIVTEDRVWVTDLGAHRVRVYDKATRRHLFAFPDTGLTMHDPGGLARPLHLAVWNDEVFVSDQFAGKVEVYSTEGHHLRTIGTKGVGFGQFDIPRGVAVDREGLVYVADFRWGHVQVFNRDGRVLTFIAGGGYRGPGYLGGPIDVAVDYDNLEYFREYVDPQFDLKYLVFVTSQLSPDKVTVYGFVEQR
jgi:DNA-binding beta-propeller fold protein YncE